ncbi:MAG: BrnT family toxin, partial [Planctomycetota bacterium]
EKHGISFGEAQSLFESGVDYLEIFDTEHSDSEDRFIAIGPIEQGIVVIVYTERDEDIIRIIGARWANAREQSLYRSYMDQSR